MFAYHDNICKKRVRKQRAIDSYGDWRFAITMEIYHELSE